MSGPSRTAILKSPLCKQITESQETWLRCRGIRHPRFCISNFAQEVGKDHTFSRRTSASSCRKPSKWVPCLAHVPICDIYAATSWPPLTELLSFHCFRHTGHSRLPEHAGPLSTARMGTLQCLCVECSHQGFLLS